MLEGVVTNIKVAAAVSVSTTTCGLGQLLDIIPDNIGKLGSFIGVVLSVVLIYVHLRRMYIEQKKAKLDIETKEIQLEKMKAELKKGP